MTEETTTAAPVSMIPDGPVEEIADGVHVILDQRVEFVPNVGIIVGERAALVVDTGMGPASGHRVLERARELAGDRHLLLTLTHFHPEHGFGAQVFQSEATILYNRAQQEELDEKGAEYVQMFSGFSPAIAGLLSDVELAMPHVVYEDRADIDLGGRIVQLRSFGQAHTRGDQVIFLPEERILFAGDLAETRFFPIMPDPDAVGDKWISVLEQLDQLGAATVVPGHGEIGDAAIIRAERESLELVRDRVGELHGEGKSLDEIAAIAEPEIQARYADWGNQMWVRFAIDRFHADLNG